MTLLADTPTDRVHADYLMPTHGPRFVVSDDQTLDRRGQAQVTQSAHASATSTTGGPACDVLRR